jgi:multisubunit Na+/H+ antiporter MnhG subunit
MSFACIWSIIGILPFLVTVTLSTRSFTFYVFTSLVLAFSIVTPSLANNKAELIIVLVVIAFIQTILMNMVARNSAYLMWDLKAQDNAASYIVQEGHMPRPLQGI